MPARHSPSGPAGISTPQYCTRHWTTYHQEYKDSGSNGEVSPESHSKVLNSNKCFTQDQCVSRMYTRACPPGQGLYEKQFLGSLMDFKGEDFGVSKLTQAWSAWDKFTVQQRIPTQQLNLKPKAVQTINPCKPQPEELDDAEAAHVVFSWSH